MTRGGLIAGGVIIFILAAAGSWLLTRPSSLQSAAQLVINADDRELITLGKNVYANHCASCHGSGLQGEPQWRVRKPDGRLPAPPHDASGHTWHHRDDILFKLTKFGSASLVGGNYETDMPAFGETLSDHEIIAALAYIKSTWPEAIRARHDRLNASQSQ